MCTIKQMYLLIAFVALLPQLTSCATPKTEWEHRPKYESISLVSGIGTNHDISVVGNEHGYFTNKQHSYGFPPGAHVIIVRYNSGTSKEIRIPVTILANHFYIVELVEPHIEGEPKFLLKDYGTDFPYHCRPERIYEKTKQISPSLLKQCING